MYLFDWLFYKNNFLFMKCLFFCVTDPNSHFLENIQEHCTWNYEHTSTATLATLQKEMLVYSLHFQRQSNVM